MTSSVFDRDSLFLKSDRIYKHQLLRVNYTTYDIRRSQDVINPRTSHRDVMVLANHDETDTDTPQHLFFYAHVLGIYHTNVVYTGPGMLDYRSRRLDFLWVRWFQSAEPGTIGWEECRLDKVSFLPMADDHAFDFIDPKDVVRGSHLVPAFLDGRVHPDLIPMSQCAEDTYDWRYCYVNR
jgi:hypothetical protein